MTELSKALAEAVRRAPLTKPKGLSPEWQAYFNAVTPLHVAELIAELARIEAARTKPVGEVAAWGENIPPRQGINRKVDFRWLDVNVEPGTLLYAAPQLQPVSNPYTLPEGWVAVPIEPTMEMLDEFDSIIDYGADDSKDAWRRLIAAAPKPDKCHK